MLEKYNKCGKDYVVLSVLTLVTVIPLFVVPMIYGDDLAFHLVRIEDIKNGIMGGQFPVYIMPESLNGYGYANGIFYPDLLLYFPALLMVLGVNLRIAYGIFMGVCTFLATFSMYICTNKILKNRNIAFYSALIYIFAEYKIANIYLRSAVGEYISFIFVPIILLGIYELLYRDYKKYYILAFGMSFVVLSHYLSVLMITFMCIIAYLLNIKILIKCPKRLINSIKAAVLTIFLTAYSWIPVVGQFMHDEYKIGGANPDAVQWAIKVSEIFSFERPARFFCGFIVIAIFLYMIVISLRKDNKFISLLFLLSILFLLLTLKIDFTKNFVNIFKILNSLQFTWRLGLIATPLLAIVFAYSLDSLFKDKFKIVLSVVIVSFLILNIVTFKEFYRFSNIDFNNFMRNYSNDIGCGEEYLPRGVNKETIFERGNLVTSNDLGFSYSNFKKNGSKISFDYNVKDNNAIIELPLLYYYGYKYEIISDTGDIIKGRAKKSEGKLVSVNTQNIKSGTLKVNYKETPYMIIGNIITIFTLIFLLFNYKIKRRSKI